MKNNIFQKTLALTTLGTLLFSLSSCGKEAVVVTPPREGKIVQTSLVGESFFREQIHVTGKVAASKEVALSTQATGFMWPISVNSGDAILAGETIARIQDTYGTAGNGVADAGIGVATAKLSRESTIATIEQSVESARLAYEKAKKDYDAATLWTDKDGAKKSKAQLDLENYITSQQKTLDSYEVTYANQLQNFQSLMTNVIETTDTLLGVSDQKNNLNDNYEYLLSATDVQKKVAAELSLKKLLKYKEWTPDPNLPILERVQELQKVYLLLSQVLSDTKQVLINTVTDARLFSEATLNAQKAIIDGYQSQYSGISTGIVTFLNNAQVFLATYEKERTSREQAASTGESNAKTALDLAQKSYETAQKTLDITLKQVDQSVSSAGIKYQNALGNEARLSVVAPFSGVIISKNTETGMLVSPGMTLFTIGDTSSLIVKTEVTLEQQKNLRVSDEIPLILAGQIVMGKIKSIAAGPDPQTRLYKAEITLPKVHPDVSLGDIVEVIITKTNEKIEQKEIVIPFSALRNLGQETYAVYVLTPDEKVLNAGIVHERIVKIGAMNETSVTVTDGIKIGERIVTIGTLNVEDGDYVQEASAWAAIEVPAGEENV